MAGEIFVTKPNPVIVEVTRGTGVESWHSGSAVVVKADGRIVAAWGEFTRSVFPRSAIKPLQALPLIESGAAEHFRVTDQEIALACASHSGEPIHTRLVSAWLRRLGLHATDLVCGPHTPLCDEAAKAVLRDRREPTPIHNNCSGKHAGFLTTALRMNVPAKSYADPDGSVQRRVLEALSDMGECDLTTAMRGTDGCGVPVVAMPLDAIALAMARLGRPDGLPKVRRAAAARILAAVTRYPYLVAGNARFDTEVMAKNEGLVVIKGGAEGVCAASLPALGLGLAVKIDDGAKRAAETAMATLLARFPSADGRAYAGMGPFLRRPIYNTAGVHVGDIRAAEGWPD